MPEKCGLMPPGLGPFVQAALGCMCVGVLAYKCSIDKSGRGTVRFIFDSSKNFAGAAWMHVANLMVAGLLGREASSEGDACQWYFIEIMIDTTLGVYVEYKLLETLLLTLKNAGGLQAQLAEMIEAPCITIPDKEDIEAASPTKEDTEGASPSEEDTKTAAGKGDKASPLLEHSKSEGEAGNDMMVVFHKWSKELLFLLSHLDKPRYAAQLTSWLVIVTGMKFVMVSLMMVLSPQLQAVAGFVLAPLQDPSVKLVMVMILTPGVMNAVQFWLQDNIFVDVAQWHEKQQLALEMASSLCGEKKAEESGNIDHQLIQAQNDLACMEGKIKEMLQGSPSSWQQLKQLLDGENGFLEKVRRRQALEEDRYSVLSADFVRKTENLHRNTSGAFIPDVVLQQLKKRSDSYSPKFTVKAETQPGQYVIVCGEGELGGWEPRRGAVLTTKLGQWPRWESESITLDPRRYMYQYKYAIMSEAGQVVRWEDGPNRTLCSGHFPATATFDKTAA
uniref:CBM20 domain-containing protein n=1 Tax=Alexandrium monilatum TaxID=311494 RepID=A0A7S4VM75_9DINO